MTVDCQDPDSPQTYSIALEVEIRHAPIIASQDLIDERLGSACQAVLDAAFNKGFASIVFTKAGRTSIIDSASNPSLKEHMQLLVPGLTKIERIRIETPLSVRVKQIKSDEYDVSVELIYLKENGITYDLPRYVVDYYEKLFTTSVAKRSINSLVETFGTADADDAFDSGLYLKMEDLGDYVIIRTVYRVSLICRDRLVADYQARQLEREIYAFYSRTPILGLANTLLFMMGLAIQKSRYRWYTRPTIKQCYDYHNSTLSHTISAILSIVALACIWISIGPQIYGIDIVTYSLIFFLNYVLFGVPGALFMVAI